MDWTQFFTLLASMAGMFLWSRSESRSDIRRFESEMRKFENEMKDFHGRLCTIEERFLNWIMKDKK